MKNQPKNNDPWQYATFEGTERFQLQQVGKMSLSERLDVLDEMISFAQGLHGNAFVVRESQASYGKFAKKYHFILHGSSSQTFRTVAPL